MNTLNPPNPSGRGPERSAENLAVRKSKLTQVLEGLSSREDLLIAAVIRDPNPGSSWLFETFDIIIAPKKPTYDSNELNEFMNSLLPEIKRDAVDLSRPYDEKSNFEIGKLYFDEELARIQVQTKKTTIITTCDEVGSLGIEEGVIEESKEEVLKRRIWLRVYPDTNISQIVGDYERGMANRTVEYDTDFNTLRFWITPDQLSKLKRHQNPITKIFGLLKKPTK